MKEKSFMNTSSFFWTKLFTAWIYFSPAWFRRFLGNCIGFLWWDLLRLRRKVVFDNLQIAFPEKDLAWKNQIARKSIQGMGQSLIEFSVLPWLNPSWIEKNVVFENEEAFHKAQQQGKGVLLLSLHLGNGDLAASILSMRGHRIHVISKKFKTKWVNDLWFGIRVAKGAMFIDPHGTKTPFQILSACKKNEGVVFVNDQFMGKPYGIETTFFGRPTGTAYGLALFAIKTGAPVLPVYTFRDSQGKTHIAFGNILPMVEHPDRQEQIHLLTQKYTDTIEELVRRYPDQWMWVHRRWKKWE